MNPDRIPARLRHGDRVELIAPAGPVPGDLLEAGIDVLESWGLRVTLGKHVQARHAELSYLAGEDQDRAADLQRAWCDPDIAAVICARGGYGCLRIMEYLDWPSMAAAPPKVFCGSSDVTMLHEGFRRYLEQPTVFSPMPATANFVGDGWAQHHLRRMLFEPSTARVLTGPEASCLVPGRARGRLVGGNASLLATALGTPDAVLPEPGSIVLLEDVTEDVYRLDRIVTQLLRAGWFDAVAGVALGSWTDCGELGAVRALMRDRLGSLGVPIVWELGFGHLPDQLTVPLGVLAELDADEATLTVLEPALRD
ncbi:muramoyltetrapeptide carboxypeptidase [Tamaricihabitans halophyticus]|uniref:Muramoyltetrapeptide carboxypeptidase n=1 Tax=Tamaricihabitans halophyticus TaxID=1262583 RepID=A0A4R2QN13_9PSEU|nr:LD-carboxypeptidase [Tamaricihabitans halophyticus]TCP50970.1 muramoyltetrapeptide carboxypeptidase [Tamaricihabitans halophyticus]